MAARLAVTALLVLSAARARADDGDPGRLRLSMTAALVPRATLRTAEDEHFSERGPHRAFAGRLSLDYACGQVFFVGLGSQYVYWLSQGQTLAEGPAEGSEADLHARIGANSRLTESWQVFAYIAPGYSVLVPSSGVPTSADPRGLVVDGTVGTSLDLLPAMFFTLEFGYQEGFQIAREENGAASDRQTRFIHVGMGLGLRLL